MVEFLGSLIKLIFFGAVVVGVIALFGYNALRALSEGVKEAWSNIGVTARKQVSLINQMIDVVKGYQDNEKFVMLKVSEDNTLSSLQQMHQQSNLMMSQLSTITQRFPELKADQHYSRLIESLQATERDLEQQRERYNAAAKQYNIRRTSIPHVFYSKALGFLAAPYLEFTGDASTVQDMGVLKTFASDDGERLNALLSSVGSKTLAIGRELGTVAITHGRTIAEVVQEKAKKLTASEFHYLDQERNPQGPVSLEDLEALARSGHITGETQVMAVGARGWCRYAELTGNTEINVKEESSA